MSAIVDRIRAKIARAKQHIHDFQLGMKVFADTNPYGVSVKEDGARGKRIYYVSRLDQVPDPLTAIAADVIQNLRSPLDHIAHQLVRDGLGGAEPEWTVYYPISGSAAHYPATRGGKIKRVRQQVIDAIDATEPYKGGKGHALWQLNELNKPDKHELLIGAATFTTGVDISVDFNQMFKNMAGDFSGWPYDPREVKVAPVFLKETRTAPLHLGDELYIEPIDKEVAQDRRFSFEVSLNAPGVVAPEPAIKTLQDMANLVDDIVTTLGKFLP
jgi:hypothetical protein